MEERISQIHHKIAGEEPQQCILISTLCLLYILLQLFTRLSGASVDENSTILTVINSSAILPGNPTPILITLLATNGGSEELTATLSLLLSIIATELGVQLVQSPQRFGKA